METYYTLGSYRPIAFLPTIKKVIEAIVVKRITRVTKVYGLLPNEQIGNKEH